MDFEPLFDCCEACNSITYQCQTNKSPIQIQGQGDCKCNIELQGNENVWMPLEKRKKLKSKFVREPNDSGFKGEQQKKYLDGPCYCCTKQDFTDKLKREAKVENKEFGSFETANYFWDTPSTNWAPKSERVFVSEGSKRDHFSNPDKLLAQNIFEFEEKVDFLFRIFKDYGQTTSNNGYIEPAKTTEGIFKDVVHLFDFNKRLCAAEEGIEKLALILEDLVKDSRKKKMDEGMNDHLDFDEMSISQRINYLKSRNDLMLSFMKAFLKAGSSNDIYSRVGSISNEYELKQKPLNAALDHGDNQQAKDLNSVRIMETLRKLRMRMNELRKEKSQQCNEQHRIRNEKRAENAMKYAKNKLEVISEQAELILSDGSENAGDNFRGKNLGRTINDKLSEINEESDESDLSVQDVTFRILSEESDFFKPFDKLLPSNEKKYGKGSNVQTLKDKNHEGDVVINFDSSSEADCIYWDGDNPEKTTERNKPGLPGLYIKKDLKEPLKREKNSLEKASKDVCKQSGASGKKPDDFPDDKIQSARKLLQKNSQFTIHPGKGSRNECSVPELCSSSRENRKKEGRGSKEQRQRPMTEPSCHRKSLPPSGLKPLVQDKYTTKISGTNNVKNKNKILLSKKSCVQTS